MRLPRVRITVRGMMVTVAAVAGLLAWGNHRRNSFIQRAEWHRSRKFYNSELSVRVSNDSTSRLWWVDSNGALWLSAKLVQKDQWHSAMAAKYSRAARRPWLPVLFDPPEPD